MSDDKNRGLYRKYALYRVSADDPAHHFQVFDPFFALRYTTDPHARVALEAYADSCGQEYPKLADDLYRALGIQVETAPADIDTSLSEYLGRHYRGSWVAIRNGHVVATGQNLKEVRQRSEGYPDGRTLIYVPREGEGNQ